MVRKSIGGRRYMAPARAAKGRDSSRKFLTGIDKMDTNDHAVQVGRIVGGW